MLELTVAVSICDHLHFGYVSTCNVPTLQCFLQTLVKHSITLLRSTGSFQIVQTDV